MTVTESLRSKLGIIVSFSTCYNVFYERSLENYFLLVKALCILSVLEVNLAHIQQ